MTSTTMADDSNRIVGARRTSGIVMLVVAAVGLIALTVSVLRVAWFTLTAGYCADGACTPSAVGASDAVLPGRDALAAAGLYEGVVRTLGYLPFTVLVFGLVLVLLVGAFLALAGSFNAWRGFFAASRWVTALRLACGGAFAYVLLYLVNLQGMLWFTHVVD